MVRSSANNNRGGQPVNKKTSCGDCISPKMFRDIHLEQKDLDGLKKMSILYFSNLILRGCINTRVDKTSSHAS